MEGRLCNVRSSVPGSIPVAAIQAEGSPAAAPIRISGAGSPNHRTRAAEMTAERPDHLADRAGMPFHDGPASPPFPHSVSPSSSDDGERPPDIRRIDRRKRARCLAFRQIEGEGRERADQRAAAVGRRRDDEARPQDDMRNAAAGDDVFGSTLGRAERRAVVLVVAGDRQVNQEALAVRGGQGRSQPRDEAGMNAVAPSTCRNFRKG